MWVTTKAERLCACVRTHVRACWKAPLFRCTPHFRGHTSHQKHPSLLAAGTCMHIKAAVLLLHGLGWALSSVKEHQLMTLRPHWPSLWSGSHPSSLLVLWGWNKLVKATTFRSKAPPESLPRALSSGLEGRPSESIKAVSLFQLPSGDNFVPMLSIFEMDPLLPHLFMHGTLKS